MSETLVSSLMSITANPRSLIGFLRSQELKRKTRESIKVRHCDLFPTYSLINTINAVVCSHGQLGGRARARHNSEGQHGEIES